METVTRTIVRHAQRLAREVGARAITVYADALIDADELGGLIQAEDIPTVLVTRSHVEDRPAYRARGAKAPPGLGSVVWVRVVTGRCADTAESAARPNSYR